MEKKERYTITAALPYTNGPVHIGHLAGVYVPGDIFARFQRLKQNDVLYLCGSDEHGVAITISAKKEGISPQEVVDKYHTIIKNSFEDFGISFDIYSRTSNEGHHKTAQEFFTKLYDQDEFIEKVSEQYYDAKENQFLADRYIAGTCPHCSNDGAYGDQCEKCGTSLSPMDLINPVSTLTGNTPELKETKHWYLPLDKYEPWLKEWILEGHKKDWKTNVYGQCKSWLEQGLAPRAVTRDLDWGIKVPIKGVDNKVLYVWFDAPLGYVSATKEWAEREGKNWEDYWKNEDTKLVHFIGKDNIVFHCIIFPSMLKAHGDYILPENVPAMEFLNLEGDKISTSRNWAVWLHEYLKDFPGKQDSLRYTLTALAPETKDNDFTWAELQGKNNSELVGVLGNFVNRVVVLTNKYWGGIVPELGELSDVDKAVIEKMQSFPDKIESSITKYRLREAQLEMMNLARLGNKYLTEEEPWKAYKTDEAKAKTILNISLQICAKLSVLAAPFLPFTVVKMSKILNFSVNTWEESKAEVLLPTGHQIEKAELLFERIDDEQIEAQQKRLADIKIANEEANRKVEPAKEAISFDDFQKMDIRVGTILTAEKVKKAKKLLKIEVDTGIDTRTVVSGIAEHFSPEELVGKQVSILVNLAPRMIRGVESQGMILMAEDSDGALKLVNPSEATVKEGSVIA